MELASQGNADQVTHGHDNVHTQSTFPILQTATTNDYLTHLDLYILATLVCVIIFMYLDISYLSMGRQNESLLKDFSQTNENPEKERKRYMEKIQSEKDERGPKEYVASPGESLFGPRESVYAPRNWLRPLGSLEILMVTGGYFGGHNTIQALRLSSSQPILPELVRHAITAVAQKSELLQVCVSWNWLRPWFCRMGHVMVPFRVEHGDVMKVYYKLLEMHYDMYRGPLWRARLVPLPQSCAERHEAVLIFTIHHAITDAFTNMIICRETLQVLNATMSGKVYHPSTCNVFPLISDELLTKRDWFDALKFAAYKALSPTIGNFNKNVYFDGVLPQPKTKIAITKVLHEEFTVESTQHLLEHCKKARVTVHSCIMITAQLAMLKLAQQHSGGALNVANVRTMNCVNMRRYYPHEYHNATGCHISVEEQEVVLHNDDISSKEKFWSLVTHSHANLQKSLGVDRNPIKNLPALLPCTLLIPLNYVLTRLGWKHINDCHIVTTNMGNLKDLLPGKYDGPVEITHLLRCVSDPLTGHPYTLIFHTFLDRFSITLEYYTTKTTDEVASQFFSILVGYISDLASSGTVGVGSDTSTTVFKNKFYASSMNVADNGTVT
ncbi:uncharacterized protein [Panulirus ornatus]|uniref:uncharacterized protein n=1 Tax=Panulirus ornatus TaxID=150431 RepID=UPI003A8426DC